MRSPKRVAKKEQSYIKGTQVKYIYDDDRHFQPLNSELVRDQMNKEKQLSLRDYGGNGDENPIISEFNKQIKPYDYSVNERSMMSRMSNGSSIKSGFSSPSRVKHATRWR